MTARNVRYNATLFYFKDYKRPVTILTTLKKWMGKGYKKSAPRIIPRDQHCISRADISPYALKVLYRLHDAGFEAFLVGGGVRDLLRGQHPKDFDIATNARPEQVKKLFKNCILIGRRFRLAHINFREETIEVATFRADTHKRAKSKENGMILRDNRYGTMVEDAWRRDFTVNALYYNIADFSVVDYTGGLNDLQHQCLRMIGDPEERYREDPVRMLRAIRFAAKLDFQLDPSLAMPLLPLRMLLSHVPAARLFEELLKLFLHGAAQKTADLLIHYQQFEYLFPATAQLINTHPLAKKLVDLALQSTDSRVVAGKSVTVAFLLAAFLWYPMQLEKEKRIKAGERPLFAQEHASDDVIRAQTKHVAIPKRFTQAVQEIWRLQYRLEHPMPHFIERVSATAKFRAAYDFLVLRAATDEPVHKQAEWWTTYQEANPADQEKMVQQLEKKK